MSDLNRRAAEAMGWKISEPDQYGNLFYTSGTGNNFLQIKNFDPCNRIEHAWMLVEWLVERGYFVDVQYFKDLEGKVQSNCGIDKRELSSPGEWYAIEWEDTAPLAITRAFLAAVGDSK